MKVNALDLSPNYAGTLMGITNGIGALTGIAAVCLGSDFATKLYIFSLQPYLVGILTPNRTLTEWRMVFFISCGFLVLTNMVYIIFATGKTQSWNNPSQPIKSLENGISDKDEKSNETEKSS